MTQGVDIFGAGRADFAVWNELLWDPMGRATVAGVGVGEGDRVLDACCGAGGSALPAAQACGPSGWVDAVDLSAGLQELTRSRASDLALDNIACTVADITTWPGEGYDVVLCCYGVFFLPEMDAATQRLMSRAAPGGRIGILTWAADAMSDFAPLMLQAIRAHHPGMKDPEGRGPAERIDTAEHLATWLEGLGGRDVQVETLPWRPPLTPDTAWSLVIGTGFRGLLPADEGTWEDIRLTLVERLASESMTSIQLDSLLVTATVGD